MFKYEQTETLGPKPRLCTVLWGDPDLLLATSLGSYDTKSGEALSNPSIKVILKLENVQPKDN